MTVQQIEIMLELITEHLACCVYAFERDELQQIYNALLVLRKEREGEGAKI